MFGGVEVARLFGIRLRLDWSWFAVLGLLTWTFAAFDFPYRAPGFGGSAYWVLGLSAALLLFASVLVHELAHALAARRRGVPVARITLFIFGGVAEMRMEAQRPADEFFLTIVGPLASLALAGLFRLAGIGAEAAGFDALLLLCATLSQLNLVLAVFNMVPAFPLDGGRILRSVLWHLTGDLSQATRWAAGGGRVFGWFLMGLGAWLFLAGSGLAGLWAFFLGWFLAGAATGALQQNRYRTIRTALDTLPITAALPPPPIAVSAALPLDRMIEAVVGRPEGAYLVERDDALVGAVTVQAIGEVPRHERADTPVFEVMTPLSELRGIPSDASVTQAVELLRTSGDAVLAVRVDGRLRLVTPDELQHWIERLERLNA